MDILSHGLWAVIVGKLYKQKSKRKCSLRWAFFWGIFPDVCAFTPAFLWLIAMLLGGNIVGFPLQEPAGQDSLPIFRLTSIIYNFSHSVVIFLAIAMIIVLLKYGYTKSTKNLLPLSLLGWPLHILMDIPTHSYRFFPTPFLWPLSSWKFNGFSWAQPWFMVVNYTAIIILLVVLWRKKKKQ